MAWTGIHYEKWLWGDNSLKIQGMIMVLGFCPFPHCHLSINQVLFKMPPVVFKLFAGQGTGWTDGGTKRRLYASPFGEHNKNYVTVCSYQIMNIYYFLWKFISLVYESLSISLKVYTCIFFIYRSVPRGGIWERGIERSDEDRVMILKNYPSIVSVRSLENQISTHYSYMWIYESLENQISTLYSYMWIYERCMGLKKSLKKASVITILCLLEYIFILHCKYHLPINFHVCQVCHSLHDLKTCGTILLKHLHKT